jgi:hypothetical protein
MRHALRKLARRGGTLTVTQLAREIGVGVPAASQLSARMVRRGLVTKERPPHVGRADLRTRRVGLTSHGWKHVPRDEPALRQTHRIGGDDTPWGGLLVPKWPDGLRRRTQEPAPVEAGLGCPALNPRGLLAGLRAVQATIHGFRYDRWEGEFRVSVVGRRRWRRDRALEGHVVALLPRPRYHVPKRRGRALPPERRRALDAWLAAT